MSNAPLDPFGRPVLAGPDSAEDLAANRAGTLTPEQKQRLQGRLLPALIGGLLGTVFVLPFVFCFAPIMLGAVASDAEAGWFPLLFIGIFGLVLLGVAAGAARGVWSGALALLDLNAGRVETVDGRLVWQRREYRGLAEGRALRLPAGDERLPGAYRFYFLPRSGLILSAERMGLGEADPLTEVRRALGEVFDFRPEDLPENQAGRLSTRQAAGQWWALVRSALGLGLFFVPFLAVFGLVFPYTFVVKDLLAGERVPLENWFGGLCAPAFILLVAVLALGSLVGLVRDLLRGEVQSIQGDLAERVIVTGSGKSRRTNYYYEINGQRFTVPAHALQASLSGRPYRVYYLPRSKHVVSAEPL